MKKIYSFIICLGTILLNNTAIAQQWTTSGSNIYNSNAGYVGIGATAPDRLLTLSGGSLGIYGSGTGVIFKNTASSNKLWDLSQNANDLNINETGIHTSMTFKAGGNVGIGTTSPGYRLDVQGNENYNYVGAIQNTATGGHTLSFGYNNGTMRYGIAITGGNNDANSYDLLINTTRFVVRGDGKVGIGTSNPYSILHTIASGSVTAAYSGNLLTNIATSTTASIKKAGIEIQSTGNWTGAGASNIGLYVSSVTGANTGYNYDAIFNGGGVVGIGTSTPDASYKLTVNGGIKTKEVLVSTGWSDFVFDTDYKLPPLEEVEKYINQYKHLPEIPSAKEVETNGADVGTMLKNQMQKIEELTLYMIDMKRQIAELQKQNCILQETK